MKKNIQINLFGTLYNIDEDAYQLLDNYLESMKRYFSTQEGGSEVADDIEHRVAELLWEKHELGVKAVNVETIREIIGKIGNAEEIGGDPQNDGSRTTCDGQTNSNQGSRDWRQNLDDLANEASEGAQHAYNNVRSRMAGKKLFRNPNDKLLGGVCSGLAKYFGGDVVLWRILAIIVFLFIHAFVLIAYIVLWIVVPEAHTAEDRLRMEGQAVNPSTLNEQVLRDQNTIPVQHNNSGCLKALLIAITIPVIFIFGIVFLSLLIGLLGGGIGVVGGLFGSLCSLMCIPFGFCDGGLVANTTAYILWGSILLIVGFVLMLWLIFSRRGSLKSATKWIIAILMAVCFFFGIMSLIKATREASKITVEQQMIDNDEIEKDLEQARKDIEETVNDLDDVLGDSDNIEIDTFTTVDTLISDTFETTKPNGTKVKTVKTKVKKTTASK